LRDVLTGQSGKLAYTLRTLLFHPGELAREIDEGRDRRAMRPLTLLLNLIAFFFVVGGGAGGFSARALLSTGIDRAVPIFRTAPGAPGTVERARFEERLEHRFQSVYSLLLVVQTLAYGAALGLVERRRRKPWPMHLAAATHYMCVSVLLTALVFGAARLAGVDAPHTPWIGVPLYGALLLYMSAMLRRAYGDARWRALGKAVGVLSFGYVVANVLAFGALALALLTA
jgi:hypothetical protein